MKVTITCRQVVEYHREVDIPEKEFILLSALNGDDISEKEWGYEYGFLEGIFDPSHIIDADREFLTVQTYPVIKKKGGASK